MTRLVVVGDALLDIDLEGRVDRLMPDAPAPVVADPEERPRPGGAALAAALAASHGGRGPGGPEIVLVTGICDDAPGRLLTRLVAEAGVELIPIPLSGRTSVKRRVRAEGCSLLRIDEGGDGRPGDPPAEALAAISSAADAVLVSDYGRGVAALPAVREALAGTPAPVVWDPHPRGPEPVAGVRLATPNRDEAERLAPETALSGLAGVSARAAALVERWQARAVAVTLGARGALLSRGEESATVVPAPRTDAADTCGAGDAFASGAALAVAEGAVTSEAVERAVATAAGFVAAGGAAGYSSRVADEADSRRPEPQDATELVRRVHARGGTVVATGGCFDLLHAGHIATLEAARGLGDCLVVCLNSDDSVRRLKGPGRPVVPQSDRARLLSALECVDAVVVFEDDTPNEVIRRLRPDVWVKGGDYSGELLPETAILREWGGQAVVVPYLEGRSTTSLVASATRG